MTEIGGSVFAVSGDRHGAKALNGAIFRAPFRRIETLLARR